LPQPLRRGDQNRDRHSRGAAPTTAPQCNVLACFHLALRRPSRPPRRPRRESATRGCPASAEESSRSSPVLPCRAPEIGKAPAILGDPGPFAGTSAGRLAGLPKKFRLAIRPDVHELRLLPPSGFAAQVTRRRRQGPASKVRIGLVFARTPIIVALFRPGGPGFETNPHERQVACYRPWKFHETAREMAP